MAETKANLIPFEYSFKRKVERIFAGLKCKTTNHNFAGPGKTRGELLNG